MIAVIPISVILDSISEANSLARVARLSRLYKLLKMIKLLRMMRIIKNRGNFQKYLNKIFKASISVERLIIFVYIFYSLSCSSVSLGIGSETIRF